jgi:peptidoglycan hydrolase-like protein with peptidoglycan-binding domain
MKRQIARLRGLILLSLLVGGLSVSACLSHATTTAAKKKTHKTAVTSQPKTSTKTKAATTKGSPSAKTQTTQKTRNSGSASTKSGRGKNGKSVTSRRDHGQKAPTPERVSEIQSALAKNGAYAGTPNGKWDDSTVEAMKKFQSSHGLNASGKLDAKTLQQLGLGSQTAGIAPPVPSTKVSTNLSSRNTVGTQQ